VTTLELFILALSLSMDAFAVSVCKGLSLGQTRVRHMLIAGAWFGGFQALMPTIGYYLGSFFSAYIMRYNSWISCLILVLIGANMIREAGGEEEENASLAAGTMFFLAIATSIDALAVGVTFAFMGVSIVYAAACIGLTTFVCSAVGIKVGKVIVRTMFLSGAISGLVGFIVASGANTTLYDGVAAGVGFTSITVAWLSQLNAFAMIVISMMLAVISKGAETLQTRLAVPASISDIITGILLFCMLGCEFFINYRLIFRSSKTEKEAAKE